MKDRCESGVQARRGRAAGLDWAGETDWSCATTCIASARQPRRFGGVWAGLGREGGQRKNIAESVSSEAAEAGMGRP